MNIMNDLEIFEAALDDMKFRPEFRNKLYSIVEEFYDRFGSLNETQIFRLTNHITLLSGSDAEELANKFNDLKVYGQTYNKVSRYFRDKK